MSDDSPTCASSSDVGDRRPVAGASTGDSQPLIAPGYRLRCATNHDADAIRHLVFTVLRQHELIPDPATTDADLNDIESSYLRSGGSFDVLIGPSGKIIGSIGLLPLGDSRCELRKMYLAAEHRGRGLGKMLLHHALESAKRLGFSRVELETTSALKSASRLYESFGFRPFVSNHLAARCDRAYYLDLDVGN